MNDAGFQERMKIACFRAITNQLFEKNLITQEELKKINKRLEKMETDLIMGKPRKTASSRKLTTV